MTRLRDQHGMTLIEVSMTILVVCVGTLATLGTYVHFSSATRTARERAVLTSVAQQQIEELRPLNYANLALRSTPPPGATTEAPRTGAAATETLAVDTTGGAVLPGADAFHVQGVRGHIYRYVTWRPASSCGNLNIKVQSELAQLFGQTQATVAATLPELCPTLKRTKRIIVAVVPLEGSRAGTPVYLSTVVNDSSSVTPGVVNNAALAVKDATTGVAAAATATPTPEPQTQTLYLYDTRCDKSDRENPSSHSTRDTSQAGFNCTTSGPAPTLMGPSTLPPAAGGPADYSTEITRAAEGGAVLLRDAQAGSCTTPDNLVYTNAETDRRRHSIKTWATKPAAASGVRIPTDGRASFTVWTATATGVEAPGRLCVTVRRSSTGEVLGHSDFSLANWPGKPTQLVTAFDLSSANLPNSERLLLTLRVPSDSGSDIQVLYDHEPYSSNLALTTDAGYGFP